MRCDTRASTLEESRPMAPLKLVFTCINLPEGQ